MRTIKIGRNPDNDIVINDEKKTVSGYHAILKVYDNGTITICDNSTNGTYINGSKIVKHVDSSVIRGDKVRLGPYKELDWSKISILVPLSDATIIENEVEESYTLGTASDNRIVISDPDNHVSRYHAILKFYPNGTYYIYDKSTNGTYVNGIKVKPKVDYPVSINDTISFSKTYQLDWNKIPNICAHKHKSSTPLSSKEGNLHTGINRKGSKIWSFILLTTIFLVIASFSLYKFYSKNNEKISVNDVITTTDPIISDSLKHTSAPVSKSEDISTLYEQNKDAVFVIYTSDGSNESQGSGFFISSRGIGVSNYHVFKGTLKGLEIIKTTSGSFKVESVLTYSEENDYIVFKVNAFENFSYLNIAETLPRVGEDVFAIGAPFGLEHTLSKGIISSYRTEERTIIQTTTEITHGSSGGPLFNMRGEVIGITTSGLSEANLNFAVSIVGMGFETL